MCLNLGRRSKNNRGDSKVEGNNKKGGGGGEKLATNHSIKWRKWVYKRFVQKGRGLFKEGVDA